jgi:hypothetical protein
MKDLSNDIKTSLIFIQYEKSNFDLSKLLEYRNELEELKSLGKYPKNWYAREKRAVDFLIAKHLFIENKGR